MLGGVDADEMPVALPHPGHDCVSRDSLGVRGIRSLSRCSGVGDLSVFDDDDSVVDHVATAGNQPGRFDTSCHQTTASTGDLVTIWTPPMATVPFRLRWGTSSSEVVFVLSSNPPA